jgi:hypothetical protein
MFLNNENWSFNGANSNQSYNYFDYPISYNVVSWVKSSYYNEENVILYNLPGKSNIVIYQLNSSCFNELLKSFISTSGKTNVDEDKLVTIFKQNKITIEFREYKNDYTSRQFSILVYNSAALYKEIKDLKEGIEAKEKAEAEKSKKYELALSEGDMLYSSGNYELAKLKYFNAFEIDRNDQVESKIELCDKIICEKLISKGDSLYNKNAYNEALSIFIKSKECSNSLQAIQAKIKITEMKILDEKIKTIQLKGEAYFKDQKYDMAIEQYNSILLLDKTNTIAAEKIKQIKDIIKILNTRGTTVFSYKNTNSYDYFQFKDNLLNDINFQINKNNNGFLNFNYLILYDTIGTNQSSVKKVSTSLTGYSTYLSNISKNGILKPANESGYFLAAQANLTFDIKWESKRVAFKLNKNKNSEYLWSSNFNSSLRDYFLSPAYKLKEDMFLTGRYVFEVKSKQVNNKTFTDIDLIKFKVAGPLSCLYSFVLPGLGTLKVTYGQKGWGRLSWFVVFTGTAIASKLYSNQQYKLYHQATNQSDMDTYYESADTYNNFSLLSATCASTIYIYDIIDVFSKGIKNLKDTKFLRHSTKKGGINIKKETIILD